MVAERRLPPDPELLLTHDAFVRGLARQLVRDPNAADDAAQDAWLAAMRSWPAGDDSGPGRAFLATVLRRLVGRRARSERREAARRQMIAKDLVVPSPNEILQREALRAAVVARVLALEPGQRDVVLLRYFEQLPPRAIARRLQLPVETVRTRCKRALANLRMQLDAGQGGRAAWVGLLLPFADGPVGPSWLGWIVPGSVSGGLGMSAQKAAVVGLAAALVAVGWWSFGPESTSAGAAPESACEVAVAVGALPPPSAAAPAVPLAGGTATLPRTDAAADAATTGAVLVKVTFTEDGTPADDCLIEVRRSDADESLDEQRGRTDATGCVRFDGLSPGKVYTKLLRGRADSYGSEPVVVVAGATVETSLQIEVGMDVHGVVVDAVDRPIADAQILVAAWGGGEGVPLARTRADGTFALRAVATHCYIGASATGFAASPLRQFTAGKGAKVELRIVLDTPAVVLRGLVVDATGRPVANAMVRAGDPQQRNLTLADGGQAMGWRPERCVSDARGQFLLQHLPAGTHPLAVRAPGLAPAVQQVTLLAGPPQQITVTLLAGATLIGRVVDSRGEPVPAEVRTGEWDDLAFRRVRAAADGSYRLDGLPPGTLQLVAEHDRAGKAEASLLAISGQSLVWNPVLDAGLTLRGRVVDADGKPLAKVMVEARLQQWRPGDNWWGFANSDAEGRFELGGCLPGRGMLLQARRKSTFPELTLRDVLPGTDEVLMQMPEETWIHIVGKVLDPNGQPLANVHVSPMMRDDNGSPAETADPLTGQIALGPYPPGDYMLILSSPGFPQLQLPWHSIAGGTTWDLGELRFLRGGEVVVNVVGTSAQLSKATAVVRTPDGNRVDDIALKDGTGRLGPLAPGDYRLHVAGETAAAVMMPFTVFASAVTRLDVQLAQGAAVTLTARVPAAIQDQTIVEFRIYDSSGTMLNEPAALVEGGRASVQVTLVPGSYRIVAMAPGFGAEMQCLVPARALTASAACDLLPK